MEKRRTVRKQTAAEVKAAVDLMAAAGGDVVSYEERYNSAIFTRRPADDEGFAALTPFTTLREIDATAARVTNDGLRHLANLRDLESLNLKGASAVDGRRLAHLKGLSRLRYLTQQMLAIEAFSPRSRLRSARVVPGCSAIRARISSPARRATACPCPRPTDRRGLRASSIAGIFTYGRSWSTQKCS